MFVDAVKWVRFADSFEALREQIADKKLGFYNVRNRSVVIARYADRFYAMRNKCPHQGKSFHGGACSDDGRIVCPVHRYSFDLETGRGHGSATEVYMLEERSDGVYLGFPYMAFRPFGSKSRKK